MSQLQKLNWPQIYKLIRFGISGGLATILYALISFSLNAYFIIEPVHAHIISYALCIPASYFMQKIFTFRHKGAHKSAISKFITVTLAGFFVGLGVVKIVDVMAYHYAIGIIAVVIIIPLINFLIFDRWVFKRHNT